MAKKRFTAEGTYFSLRASAVFQTIPEDNKKSLHNRLISASMETIATNHRKYQNRKLLTGIWKIYSIAIGLRHIPKLQLCRNILNR
ncbi:MAG: hypothetical protein ACT6FC_00930 [Methanosarcinaceae archaeon]